MEEFGVCEQRQGYIFCEGRNPSSRVAASPRNEQVEAFRPIVERSKTSMSPAIPNDKSPAGENAVLALRFIRRLIKHQEKGVSYAVINAYLLKMLGETDWADDVLTYNPRGGSILTYSIVIDNINRMSAMFDWSALKPAIDGLEWN